MSGVNPILTGHIMMMVKSVGEFWMRIRHVKFLAPKSRTWKKRPF